MANNYNGSVEWSLLPRSAKAENTTWSLAKVLANKFGSSRDVWSQLPQEFSSKSNLTPGDDELLFRQADKYFSKFVNTAILNMFLQTLIEAVHSFLPIPVSSKPEVFDVEAFSPNPPTKGRTQRQYRVKRSSDSFLTTTIYKIWDFIRIQVLFVAQLFIPSPIFKLLETLVAPLQEVFDLIRSFVLHILKKLFSDPQDNFDDDLDKIMHDFAKRLEELLKSSKNLK